MRAVQRILSVFESFSPDRSSLSLHELSLRMDLPKSTAFRIVQSLEEAGYLVRLDDQQYCLSFRITRLAGLVRSTLGIREIARPIMTQLAESTSETVTLQTASAGHRVCIDAVSTSSLLRTVTQPGEHAVLTAGASSKMLLACMPRKDAARFIAEIAATAKRTQSDVVKELDAIRERGYAVSHQERVLGVSAIAAPILGLDEQSTYCVSIAGPASRVQARQQELVKLVVVAASEISRRCGAQAELPAIH